MTETTSAPVPREDLTLSIIVYALFIISLLGVFPAALVGVFMAYVSSGPAVPLDRSLQIPDPNLLDWTRRVCCGDCGVPRRDDPFGDPDRHPSPDRRHSVPGRHLGLGSPPVRCGAGLVDTGRALPATR